MINTKKLLYFAYGTNLNKKIFLKKYKNAKYLSKHILNISVSKHHKTPKVPVILNFRQQKASSETTFF